jgi:hypothetical protein
MQNLFPRPFVVLSAFAHACGGKKRSSHVPYLMGKKEPETFPQLEKVREEKKEKFTPREKNQ